MPSCIVIKLLLQSIFSDVWYVYCYAILGHQMLFLNSAFVSFARKVNLLRLYTLSSQTRQTTSLQPCTHLPEFLVRITEKWI